MKLIIPLLFFALLSLQAQKFPNYPSGSIHKQNTHRSSKALRSMETSDLLNSTDEARVAIEAGEKDDALFHIDHALQLADRVQNGSSRFVPLYQELERYSVIGPIMSERNRQQNTPNPSNSAHGPANATARTGTAVRKVTGEYTSVALDIRAAKDHLNAAKEALNNGDFEKADAALTAVQNGLVVETVAGDLPLLRARENLILARESANRANYTETHTALRAASDALMNYAQNNPQHASDVRMLRSEIDQYNQSIQQNHSDAVSKIDSWWDQTTGWVRPPSESTGSTPNRSTHG